MREEFSNIPARTDNPPKGAEITCREWLVQIGATNIRFTGGSTKKGSADFVVEYKSETIAVQASLLYEETAWGKTNEAAFDREMRKLIDEESSRQGAPRWHSRVEYDPQQAWSSIGHEWKKCAQRALRTDRPGGKFPLLPRSKIKGRGVTLTLWPASNEGSYVPVSKDSGNIFMPATVIDPILGKLEAKTTKAKNGSDAGRYDRWWLVLDNEIACGILPDLVDESASAIRDWLDRKFWSKIVLVSRFQDVPPPQEPPKRFHAVWEDPQHAPLPKLHPALFHK